MPAASLYGVIVMDDYFLQVRVMECYSILGSWTFLISAPTLARASRILVGRGLLGFEVGDLTSQNLVYLI